MNNHKQYWYRRDNRLCVICGKTLLSTEKTRCEECAAFLRAKQNEYYKNLPIEEKVRKIRKHKEYLENHPEKVALYKSRQSEYNRRYREKEKTRYEW